MSRNSKSGSRRGTQSRLSALHLGAASLISITTAGVVQAQEASQEERTELEELVVTGTRIRGVKAPVGSDMIAIDAAEMRDSGRATTADLLKSVPQVTNLGSDESRLNGTQRAISNAFGGSAINLRGLGVEATLTLLDGRRPLPGGGEGRWFDPNTIPSIALQRVEVVADGSSAIYGSDAMTGVVNLITRRNYDGAESVVDYGGADGYDRVQVQQLLGKTFERGSVLAALEYFDRGNLDTADRPELYDNLGALTFVAFPANVGAAGFRDANNNGILDTGEATGPRNTQSNWLGVDVLPKQERKSAFVSGDFEVQDWLKLYGEGYYSKRQFERDEPARSFSNLTVPATNPYNATGAPATVTYSFINDMGNQRNDGSEEFWQATFGGTLSPGAQWQIDTFVSYGETEGLRVRDTLNNGALGAALNSSSTATAFNPFSNGTTGWPSQTVKDSVIASFWQLEELDGAVDFLDTQIKADGPLFSVPGGDVRLAVGAEHQEQNRSTTITNYRVTGALASILPEQEREVDSVFAELFVPIVGSSNAVPGIQSLSLSLAARYDKYDDVQRNPGVPLLDADTTNPKFGVTWQPIDSLTFRGSYGTSFRAPALGDYGLGAPTIMGLAPISQQVATAYGLPAGNGQYGSVNIQGGHTLGLQPEESTTWSFGVEFSPAALEGLTLSATYYNIKFDDQIAIPANPGSLQSLNVVNALVNSTGSFVLPGLGFVVFNPTTAQLQAFVGHGGAATAKIGPLAANPNLCGSGSPGCSPTNAVYVLIDSLSNNTGVLETNGIDFAGRYAWQTGVGNWVVGTTFTYVRDYDQALVSSLPLTDFRNQVNFPLKFQGRAQFGWQLNNWNASAYVNYQNSYTNPGAVPAATVDSYTTLDLRLAYDTGDLGDGNWLSDITFAVSALNALDEDPPYAVVTQGPALQNYDSQNASAVGRFVSFQVAKRW